MIDAANLTRLVRYQCRPVPTDTRNPLNLRRFRWISVSYLRRRKRIGGGLITSTPSPSAWGGVGVRGGGYPGCGGLGSSPRICWVIPTIRMRWPRSRPFGGKRTGGCRSSPVQAGVRLIGQYLFSEVIGTTTKTQ